MDTKKVSFILIGVIVVAALAFVILTQFGDFSIFPTPKEEPLKGKKVVVNFKNISGFKNMTSKPKPVVKPVPKPPAEVKAPRMGYFVQAGAFRKKSNIARMEKRLKKMNLPFEETHGELTKFLIPVKDKQEGKDVIKRLKKAKLEAFIIRRDP